MSHTPKLTSLWMFVATVVMAVWFPAFTGRAEAQGTEGQNAVYNSSNGVVGSSAFIDASMYLPPHSTTQGRDLCDAIYGIFNNFFGNTYPATGAVIDARGVSGSSNLTCTLGSPWTEGSTTVTAPSTILLPATSATAPIVISSKWIFQVTRT